MCALDAAGFNADESALGEMPARLALRADLLKMQGPSTQALRQFYRDHALADPSEMLSRYVTLALFVGPPPGFEFETDRDLLPPDVLSLDGFQSVLAGFYREAHLDIRWAKIEPEYGPALDRYGAELSRIVTISNAYLREIPKPSSGRAFTVYVEPLVGSLTNFRNSGNHYSIVVGTGNDTHADAIQHAYLHFMLDPFVLRYRPLLDKKAVLLTIAAAAPRLPEEYHDDFFALTDECLIKAVELRLRHLSGAQLEAALVDMDQSGFILVRPLVAQLQKFEKDQPAMSYYFPDLIAGIDVQAEQQRFRGVKFAAATGAADTLGHQDTPDKVQASELERLLDEGNREIANRDGVGAAATFQTALSKYPNDPQAMYGLAIASVISGKGDQAGELFEKIVAASSSTGAPAQSPSTATDPAVLAWSHVYLGRIHDLQDERDLAVNEYRAGLAVNGAPEAARVAAQNGITAPYKSAAAPAENREPQP
jgi:hypothetical protein